MMVPVYLRRPPLSVFIDFGDRIHIVYTMKAMEQWKAIESNCQTGEDAPT